MKAILVLVLLMGVVFAQTAPSGNPQCTLIDNGDGTTTIDYNDSNCQDTLEYKEWKCSQFDIFSFDYAGCAIDGLLNPVFELLNGFITWLTNTVLSMMFYSPDFEGVKPKYIEIRDIAQSILSVLVALLGLYWIMGARSLEGRIKAKVWSERLIALIIIQSVGMYLYGLAVGLNDQIAGSIIGSVNAELFGDVVSSGATAAIMILVAVYGSISIGLTVLTLVARQILLAALFIFFPITLLLYMTPPTKKWGSLAMNLTLVVIFMGALDAIMLYGGSSVLDLIDLQGLDVIIRPLIIYTIFGAIGGLNIYVLMTTPGLSGGLGMMNILHTSGQKQVSAVKAVPGRVREGYDKSGFVSAAREL